MFYKIKVLKDKIQVISKVERAGKDGEFLYITQDEMDRLNPKIVEGYQKDVTIS